MLRINSLGVTLLLIIMIVVGCGPTKGRSPVVLDGAYRFTNIVTESNCMKSGIAEGAWGNTIVEFSRDNSTLSWSQFYVGEYMQGMQISEINGNQANFVDMNTDFNASHLKWNAMILFSDTGFAGTGEFMMNECEGLFTVVGTLLHH